MNIYKPAATLWAQRQGKTLREWLTIWSFDDALMSVTYGNCLNPSDRNQDAAMWLWYMAARTAGDKLTINADKMPGEIMTWKCAAAMVPNLIHPSVYTISRPYQLVIS